MREELKKKLELLLWEEIGVADYNSLTDKIADLINQDQQEMSIDDSYAHLKDSFDKLDQALDEHFAVIDKIRDVFEQVQKIEEVKV